MILKTAHGVKCDKRDAMPLSAEGAICVGHVQDKSKTHAKAAAIDNSLQCALNL